MQHNPMYRDLIVNRLRCTSDVHIKGNLTVEGTLINSKPPIELDLVLKRLEHLETENKDLREIVTRLQYHPDSPYVADVATEWYDKCNNPNNG